ncbi:MAG: response regulator [Candidatus Obscuribacterales bacterium]|nr:response regulator [Candidatus Obscuribacterales bacterium]
MKILLAEDDNFLADGLSMVLKDNGYAVDVEADGASVSMAVSTTAYDLLILDLGLPNLDGLDVLKQIRLKGETIPILILTARDALQDRVKGLDLGANDYLTKPFELPELEARIRALIRKDSWSNKIEINLGSLTFNTVDRVAYIDGKTVDLTARELAVLEILLQKVGTSMDKQRITSLISSWDQEVTENAVGIVIHRLRKKLEEANIAIITSRGLGYRLEATS